MNKPKIIFIDLDGTTMDTKAEKWFQKRPSEFTKEIVKQVSQTIPVVVSTGRGVNQRTKEIVESLGSSNYIAWNGAQTVIDGEVVSKEVINDDLAQELFNEIAKNNCFVVYNSNPREQAFVRNKLYKMVMGFGKHTARIYKEYNNDFPVYKALIWSISKRKIRKLADKWSKQFEGKLEIALSGSSNSIIEITRANVSKGDAEIAYCQRFNIDPKDAIHIGDSLNDASTKGKIGKLVAMKNSVPELIAMSDEVTEFTCDESGMAKYIQQFIKD
ncbi:HAD-IIB family hydrolase [Mycoplasma sp. NEAQ87857]|uniref:HAD-IIB family hydrolase n=1 Tax=Mycoplasma sp. NEAQ87857 TaxID=2683967 RepID=UPI001317E846|nr:HAD-IIB family hydrolase [Mycoplasma sp. NEAQ87857]QGZ97378.1 HAD-IIB family hydrolase [Mycoplasma sp. NEAQ87857]